MALPADELVSRAIGGDADALSALLAEAAPRLRAEISIDPRWNSVLDADDVLQVTFLEAFLQVQRFQSAGPGAFYGWLRRIADNNLRDAVKGLERLKRPPPVAQMAAPAGGDSVVALFELLGVTTATPSRAAAAHELQSALDAALATLPGDYGVVVRKYDLEGLPIADVAAAVGRSAGAVHMLRARAHNQLAELLGPSGNFFSRTSA